MKRIQLCAAGVEVSRLAIGTGTNGWQHSSDQTRRGKNWLSNLLIEGLDYGVTFWDLADQYGSHPFAATALKKIQRGDVQILTKTTAVKRRECESDLKRFRRELGTDFIDVVLLHCVSSATWNVERRGAMEALSKAKAAGAIRAVGVSCHSFTALKTASEEPWVDVIFARINYAGESMDGKPEVAEPILRSAHDNGKGLVAMKVFGCGKLTDDLEKAMRYVTGLGVFNAITIGPTEGSHLKQNVRLVEAFEG